MASGSTGHCHATPVQRRPTLTKSRAPADSTLALVCSVVSTITHLFAQANARIDVRVKQVNNQIDQHDHDPSLHDDPLDERKIALEDPLVEQPADAGPGKDDLDDHCGIDHDDEVDTGQGEHRYQRVLKGVYGEDDITWQALQAGQFDVFAAQDLEHTRAG